MCASYGLGGGPREAPVPTDLSPLDERTTAAEIAAWAADRDANARITGKRARNLNPIIFGGDAGRSVEFAWWWLWLDGHGPAKFDAFNSRDDKLLRSWRKYLGGRRAIVPATWYVEKGRTFELDGGETFGIAAITHTVVEEATGQQLTTYSLVTRESRDEGASVHPRMPMLLPRDGHDHWLDPNVPGDADLVEWAQNASEEMAHTVRSMDPDALF